MLYRKLYLFMSLLYVVLFSFFSRPLVVLSSNTNRLSLSMFSNVIPVVISSVFSRMCLISWTVVSCREAGREVTRLKHWASYSSKTEQLSRWLIWMLFTTSCLPDPRMKLGCVCVCVCVCVRGGCLFPNLTFHTTMSTLYLDLL